MSSSEEQETFTTTGGSPEPTHPIRRSARVALFAQAELAEEFNVATLSRLDTLRNALQETADAQQRVADFEGFPEQPSELNPQVEQRTSTPRLATLPRRRRTPRSNAHSLVRNRISQFETRSLTDVSTAGASGWVAELPVYPHTTNNTPRGSPPDSPTEPINNQWEPEP